MCACALAPDQAEAYYINHVQFFSFLPSLLHFTFAFKNFVQKSFHKLANLLQTFPEKTSRSIQPVLRLIRSKTPP
jgi:hypothetical protein